MPFVEGGTIFTLYETKGQELMSRTIQYFYASNIGRIRRTNQDNFLVPQGHMPWENSGTEGVLTGKISASENPVFAVFDGMGGEERGEMAAAIAAETLSRADLSGDPIQGMLDFCFAANEEICRYTRENEITSMGTTAAILRFSPEEACLCNIGDSKILALSGGAFVQLSCDHLGIAVCGRKPPLTQNLGIPTEELIIEPFVARGNYFPGDIFLLCSDGLTDMVSLERIGQILAEMPPEIAPVQLLQEALDNGGKDNVTLVLLYITDNE